MAISSLPLFFLFSILMISSIKNFVQVHGKCLHDQKTLLLKLRSELNFNSSHSLNLVSWNHTNDCCSWEGVDCDDAGHIITLQLDDDAISGELKPSSSLFGLKYLETLSLSHNLLNGTFQLEKIQNFPNLSFLDLSHNNLSVDATNMSSSSYRFPQLSNLLLASCNLHGFLLGNSPAFTQLQVLDLSSCNLQKYPYFIKQSPLTYLDLSRNKIAGEILDEVGDHLRSLNSLNFSHNTLSGTIPKSLGNLTQLKSLDLSSNQLTGTIPEELARLTNLTRLNLSYNKLVGVIPKHGQLQTFIAETFEGNPRLCGFPLNNRCKNTNDNNLSPPQREDMESKREIGWGYVIAALGYALGLGSIVWLLILCRSFREKYFDKIDEIFNARNRTKKTLISV